MRESAIWASASAIFLGVIVSFLAPVWAEPPFYADKGDVTSYIDSSGERHPVKTIADWERRRSHILENMQVVMGPFPDEAKRVPLDVQITEETDFPGYVRKRLTYAAEPGDRVPAFLLIPKGLKEKAPGVVCLHPTYEDGKDIAVGISGKPNRNYAQELAEHGYVTIAPDYLTFGEYRDVDPYAMGYVSATMKSIWNHVRAVDLLVSLPEVDPERIGAIGHSLGGHNTLFLGVFDPRVRVMVTSCGFNAFPKYYGGDLAGWAGHRYMPRIASVYGNDPAKMPFDFTEILAALAPRPVFVNAPLHDDNFEVSGVYDCLEAAKPVYALYGAADKVVAEHPDCEHDFPPEVRGHAYAFIDTALGHTPAAP